MPDDFVYEWKRPDSKDKGASESLALSWPSTSDVSADQALNREIIRLACALLDHDSLKGKPVGIIIEFQLYFQEFWDLREITHIWYKVGRPDNLDSKSILT